jgi:hypothetical protein
VSRNPCGGWCAKPSSSRPISLRCFRKLFLDYPAKQTNQEPHCIRREKPRMPPLVRIRAGDPLRHV